MDDINAAMNKKSIILKYNSTGGLRFLRFNLPQAKDVQGIKTGYVGAPYTGMQMPAMQQQIPMMQQQLSHSFQMVDTGAFIHMAEIQTEKKSITEDEETDKTISMKYPLVPNAPKQGETVFAYAVINFDPKTNEIVYNVVEPALDAAKQKLLDEIKEYIQEKIDINFAQIRKKETIDYLIKFFDTSVKNFRFKMNSEEEKVLKYYIIRDFIGLEKLEPLMNDKNIEDISCDGTNIPIYVYHRDPRLGSIKTNIMFNSKDELDSFVNKISERCGKTISVAKPLLDGTLPDGSRIQATLGSDIARRGSNFTIRMFTEEPITPVDIINFGTADLKSMAYFWTLVEHGFSILVSGGTATGKTSMLNALSLFIKPQMKIVSIEDTAELRLPHPHWVPEVARTPIAEEGKVDMFELLKESLRQRPDYIIVGEVRGKEAYVLFQQMAVGHAGLSTIHAENFPKLFDRLISPPISLPPNLIQNLDVIVFLQMVRKGRKYHRRISSVVEVIGYDAYSKSPVVNEIMKWDPKDDSIKTVNKSYMMKKISDMTSMKAKDLNDDLMKKANVLKWLIKHNITDYKKIGSVINLFYTSPDFLLGKIGGEA